MKATSHCGFTKGGTQSLERQALCTREVTGRRRRHRTGACVLTSSNPGTHPRSLLTSLDRHLLFLQYLISGAQLAYEHHVDFVSMRMCMFHTLSNLTVPPNVHTHFVFTLGKKMYCTEAAVRCVEVRWCRRPHMNGTFTLRKSGAFLNPTHNALFCVHLIQEFYRLDRNITSLWL